MCFYLGMPTVSNTTLPHGRASGEPKCNTYRLVSDSTYMPLLMSLQRSYINIPISVDEKIELPEIKQLAKAELKFEFISL